MIIPQQHTHKQLQKREKKISKNSECERYHIKIKEKITSINQKDKNNIPHSRATRMLFILTKKTKKQRQTPLFLLPEFPCGETREKDDFKRNTNLELKVDLASGYLFLPLDFYGKK